MSKHDDEEQESQITASEWRRLRVALAERLGMLTKARDETSNPAEKEQLQKRIDDIKQQVKTLAVEETVAQFVEDAERYVITSNVLGDELGRDPDEEPA